MHIRAFHPNDTGQISELLHDTIRNVNLGDYTEEQAKFQAPENIHFRD